MGESLNLLGRYYEFLLCTELSKYGYHVVHVDRPGYDVVLEHPSGALYKIQVKHSSQIKAGKYNFRCCRKDNSYITGSGDCRRPVNTTDADILALYCTHLESFTFVAVTDPGVWNIAYTKDQFTRYDFLESFQRAIEGKPCHQKQKQKVRLL
jgi:hypothetical protein